MRYLTLFCLLATGVSCSPKMSAQSSPQSSPSSVAMPPVPNTVSDIDITIQDFENQKKAFISRRNYASRQAQRLLPIDYFQARNYANQADRYDQLIQDIDEQIQMLEQKRQQLATPKN